MTDHSPQERTPMPDPTAISRRALLVGGGSALAVPLLTPPALGAPGAQCVSGVRGVQGVRGMHDACRFVDPFLGTGGHAHTYPGAATPFGMVQLGPDTDNSRWDACSGYHLGDATLMGFSHTHLSGTGIGDMLDVLLRPAIGPVRLAPGTLEAPEGSYRARFDHADEHAGPGYYRVLLPDDGIVAELTATPRTGLSRFTFHKGGPAHLLVDFAHGMQDRPGVPTRVEDATLEWRADGTLVGGRRVFQWAKGRHLYFALRLSRPIRSCSLYGDDAPIRSASAAGRHLKAVLHLGEMAGAGPLLVKVGISAVDIDGAVRNLEAEQPGWDFDAVRAAAHDAWRERLSRIRIDARTDDEARVFYSALYHTLLAPTLFSDSDGRYRGMDDRTHTLPPGETQHTGYSLWDTYRAEMPLLTLIEAERLPSILNSLVRMAEESPAGLPVWPLQGIETGCMIGHHSVQVLAEAQHKRIEGVAYADAWPAMRRLAFTATQDGLAIYRSQGWIPADQVVESASRTLEYAYDDWAMSRYAATLGHDAESTVLRRRSLNYRHLFDASTQFVRPRLADGRWAEPFAPNALGHWDRWHDFTECNAWQATFLTQHDPYGLIGLFGDDAAFVAKLDGLFDADPALPPGAPPDIAGLVGQYAHGNEPSHHIAYLYAYAGVPWKTQLRVRELMRTMYGTAPDAIAGNEDCGQMSAWFVLSALGLYAVDPVTGVYVFGSPALDRAELTLRNGAILVIEATGNGPDKPYVSGVTWQGRRYPRNWIDYRTLMQGGRLTFIMSNDPNSGFGSRPDERPPGMDSFV